MLKTRPKRSLTLTTQTLRVLDITTLRDVAGGTILQPTYRLCATITALCRTDE